MKRLLISLSMTVALLVPTVDLNAQVMNRLGVDEDVFQAYAECRTYPLDPSNLAVADSLYQIGVERNDYKIKTLALNVAFPAQFAVDDFDGMERSIEEIKAIRTKHPDINDIYFVALYSYCQYILYTDRENEAILKARDMVNQATDIGDPYGLMLAYRTLAYIYDDRKNYKMAAECYTRAAEYCLQTDAMIEYPTIKVLLAQELIELGCFDEAAQCLTIAEEHIADSPILEAQFCYIACLLGVHTGDNDLFWKYYSQLEGNDYYYTILDEDSRNYLSIFYLRSRGKYNEALDLANDIVYEKTKVFALSDIYSDLGDFETSNHYLLRYVAITDSLGVEMQNDDVAMLDAELANYQISSYAEKMRGRAQMVLTISIAAMMALVAGFLTWILIRTRKYQQRLERKNWELLDAKEATLRALEKARAANDIKTRFLQNMSHEIRTPLNAVVGFSQLMSLPDITQEEKDEYGGIVMNNTQLLTMLVDDILSLSDVENGNYKINKTRCNCTEVGAFAAKTVETRVPAAVELRYESEVEPDFMVYTDERRVQQVLINFLTNACKHTLKGSITMRLYRSSKPGIVCFSVTDTGTGVPEEKAEVIFDRFVKLDSYKQGAGIGLNICKVIAKNLGGDVYLDKYYKEGARFIFEFSEN